MRIVVVSGHYPPNFISGGTLQPQRLARGLRARGHDVSVYAGWMARTGPDRPPLSTWREVDAEGLEVHWIATTPFEPWREQANFDNPGVHEDFARYLGEQAPEVVHLHDLQMLGGSLVRAAAESGARVVVTMHDFWWVCARLFLVDRRMRPCSIVTDLGSCGCEVNEAWRRERAARLAAELAHADLVLAPSASAARVLVANGLAPDRVEVDENGLPDDDLLRPGETSATPAEHRGPVRFAYAGGAHDLKGSTVLLRAVHKLHAELGVSGWRLDTYGSDVEHVSNVGVDLDEVPVTFHPSFTPEGRDLVFGRMDVLVLPSIMLETHSILVREALARGVPVLCTNTLGPEEVVVHGVNGWIVPAGDHDALAAAMARIVDEPGLLAKLGSGAAAPVSIRSLHDQVDGLEHRYRRLAAGPRRGGPAPRTWPRLVVFACGIESAPLRYRARLPAEAIAPLGVRSEVRHYRDPALPRLVEQADVLYVYRVPATGQFLDVVAAARRRGIPVIFDVDDLIFDPDLAPEIPALQILSRAEAEGWLYGVRRYRTTMEHCDGFVGSTPMLVEHAQRVTGLPAARFDNGVGILLGRASEAAARKRRKPGPPRIGFLSGTITHDRDWFWVEPAVIETLDRHPETELWLGGHLPESAALERFGRRVKRIPFTPWLQLPGVLHQLDVNLAPLESGSRFNEAKSAIKWLEAALVGTPSVVSATGPFREAVDQGVTGFLADDLDSWAAALDALVSDPDVSRLMGLRARREALLRWSPAQQGRRFLEVLEQARAWPEQAAGRPDGGWQPAVADEPFEPIALEPYIASRLRPVIAVRQQAAMRLDWYRERLEDSVTEQGVGATARRLPPALLRRARAAAGVARRSRPVLRGRQLATHGRRMLRESGPLTLVVRSARFAVRRLVVVLMALPGIRHARAAWHRLTSALATHGPSGMVELARPVVRYHAVHGLNVLRSIATRVRLSVRARILARLRRRG